MERTQGDTRSSTAAVQATNDDAAATVSAKKPWLGEVVGFIGRQLLQDNLSRRWFQLLHDNFFRKWF
ncbi:hypothetical protein HPP92_021778 [Vanilla planifolia]|uniref:Uncharacterized protein n=1 Tax=Vanilla planifolia TaxID=51239 RepID=A0A835UF11_VANPL|nr:hypothetical protein HPP92_021778 [Vanilla planifolia]